MASFLRSQLANLVIRALNRSIADGTLDTLVTCGEGQILKVAYCMHVTIILLDCLIDLVFGKFVEIPWPLWHLSH
eukprot:458423-Ditylum_brightwellii.AAC.1